jgi:hypothetical protein|eukprot:COSAG06_NODE_5257_length_3605_cov_2.802624_2_plen_94_part_00
MPKGGLSRLERQAGIERDWQNCDTVRKFSTAHLLSWERTEEAPHAGVPGWQQLWRVSAIDLICHAVGARQAGSHLYPGRCKGGGAAWQCPPRR